MPPERASEDEQDEKRPLILHVSGDFPDPFEAFKTPVIRQLIELTGSAFDHRVISINRASPSVPGTLRSIIGGDRLATEVQAFDYGIALRYEAPGKGIRHRTKLEQLGQFIAARIAEMDRKPDLVVGHKLSIEGIAVQIASQRSGIPYALSIQGKTDLRILRSRPDLKSLFRDIFHGAQVVFPFAPWALQQVEAELGKRSGPTCVIPCPTELDQPTAPRLGGNGLITVFHLKNHATKNLAGIVKAYRHIAGSDRTPPPLEVIGGGTGEELATCKAMAADFPQITFAGPMEREPLRERMNRASALIMPSLRESFGLVFVEALFAGTPIIYPQGTAVDGYFDDRPFALRVAARDAESIAEAIERSIADEVTMKAELSRWQEADQSRNFTRRGIAEQFTSGLRQATRLR